MPQGGLDEGEKADYVCHVTPGRSPMLDIGEGLALDRNTDICFSAWVRTTLDIEENLYRRVKAKAAMEGRTVTELVEAGLRTVMETHAKDSIDEPAWKRFAGVWSGPGWDKDRKLVDAEIAAAFGSLEPEDRMSPGEVAASWKNRS